MEDRLAAVGALGERARSCAHAASVMYCLHGRGRRTTLERFAPPAPLFTDGLFVTSSLTGVPSRSCCAGQFRAPPAFVPLR
jgi:hypothetical protein